nr:orf51 [Streptococcus phage TP-J34]
MIDKKVIEKRKQDDYMNKLHRTILELSIKPPEPEPWYRHPEMRALLDRIDD